MTDNVHQNELNAHAMGGSELMYSRLEKYVDPVLLKDVQVILSRFRGFDEAKKYHILWVHDLVGDPESHTVFDHPEIVDRLDYIVFVSMWQRDSFRAMYSSLQRMEVLDKCVIIRNCVEPFPERTLVKKDKLNLIYTPTPHRGLDVLIPVFDALTKLFPGKLHLDVYSSFNLYGWGERDKEFKDLFDRMDDHPDITNHGTVSNDEVRAALMNADIFAYPSTWQETSCLCIIEAMSAKCFCVTTDLAALPETTSDLVQICNFYGQKEKLASDFYANMIAAIQNVMVSDPVAMNSVQSLIKAVTDMRYSPITFGGVWTNLLQQMKHN